MTLGCHPVCDYKTTRELSRHEHLSYKNIP